tara:strand:- start:27792 stop:28232 length:441 start_codon:yes stop_codon:yes gene_type:complete
MNRNWTKVTKTDEGEFNDVTWKCEDQPELEGTLTEIKTGIGRHSQTIYVVETEDGDTFNVWETAVLKTLLKKSREGDYIRIVYLGKKSGKAGSTYKDFDVFIATGVVKEEAKAEVIEKPEPKVEKKEEPKQEVAATSDNEEEEVPF